MDTGQGSWGRVAVKNRPSSQREGKYAAGEPQLSANGISISNAVPVNVFLVDRIKTGSAAGRPSSVKTDFMCMNMHHVQPLIGVSRRTGSTYTGGEPVTR
ncbi:MAG: hypothetical protein HOF01_11955 [Chloroflexi bacterium]|nr:hypothetical protein [Chloroflexota bacterium]